MCSGLDKAVAAPRRRGLALRMPPPPAERHGAEDDKDVNQQDDSPGSDATRTRYPSDGANPEKAFTRDATRLPTEIDLAEPLAQRPGKSSSRHGEDYHSPWAP